MNKFFTKIAGLTLGLAMAIGVGVAVGSKSSDVKRADADTTDELTRATTGVTSGSTSYSSWSGKKSNSNAVYAGKSAGGNNSIQLRSNSSDSGIITTTSGGKLKSVTVVWNTNSADGRTIDIYGKNSAYSAASDLYGNSKGTKIGSIVYKTSTSLTVTGDYEYFGIRSNNGALYLNKITIVWGSSSVTPTEVTVSEKTPLSGTYKGSATYVCQASVAPSGAPQNVDWSINTSSTYASTTTISGKASIDQTGTITFFDNTTVYAFATAHGTTTRSAGFSVQSTGLIDPPTYSLVTKTSDLTIGSKLILTTTVSNTTYVGSSYSSSKINPTEVTVSNSKISTGDAYVLTLGGSASDGWTLQNSSDKYLAYSSGTNFSLVDSVTTDNHKWTIEITDNVATILNKGDTSRRIRYNTASTGLKFGPYSTSGTDMSEVQLYGILVAPADASSVTVQDDNEETSSSINLGASINLTASFDSAATTTSCNWTIESGSSNGSLNKTTGMSVTFTASQTNYGSTVIRATAADTTANYGEYTVVVVDNRIHVTAVDINNGASSISCQLYGSKVQLTVTLTGEDDQTPTDDSVTWSITSGNDKIALSSTTEKTITLSALSSGTAVVKCTANDSTYDAADSITVVVNDPYVALNTEVYFYTDVDKNSQEAKYELTSLTENTGTSSYGTATAYSTAPGQQLVFTVVQGYESGYVAFKTPDNKYLSHTSGGISLYLATVSNSLGSNNSWIMDTYETNYVKIIPANESTRFICLNKATEGRLGCYTSIQTAYVRLGTASELVADTVTITDPGTIYDGDTVNLSATVAYVGVTRTNNDVTWSKVSGSSSITPNGEFTANGTTATVVKATSNVNGASGLPVTAEITIIPEEKLIISGQKYFVVTSEDEIFLAKSTDGSYTSSGASSKDNFFSTATISSDGKNILSIDGVDDNLEDYAWTLTETDISGQYLFTNDDDKHFNVFNSGQFYVDTYTENFEFPALDDGYYGILSKETNTYLNIVDGSYKTDSSEATSGYRFIKYHEFGEITKIEVDVEHTKTAYSLDSTFSKDDVRVIAYDEEDYSKILGSSEFECSSYNLSVLGEQTVVVTASGKQDSYEIRVVKSRTVIALTDISGTFDFNGVSGTSALSVDEILEAYDSDGLSSPSITKTNVYQATNAMRLATGSNSGSITFNFGSDSIKKIEIVAHGWSSSEKECTMTIKSGDTLIDTVKTTSESSDSEFTINLENEVSSITFSSQSDNRICIKSIIFSYEGERDIGLTDDCLGLEAFIDEYLHMSDYPGTPGQTGPGWCKDETHHYYSTAKAAFNKLNLNQRTLFSSNNAYAAEWARLSAWAKANSESLNGQNKLGASTFNPILLVSKNASATIIVVVISAISVAAIGGYFLFRKKKED